MSTPFFPGKLTITQLQHFIAASYPIAVDEAAWAFVEENHRFLKTTLDGKLIYGINTGFGPMARHAIAAADAKQLQYNLIRSHSSGMGSTLTELQCRAVLVARFNTLMLGYSGVHPASLQLMQELLNAGAYPCIPAHGGVGASGDLVQLAHLALGLIGEGTFWHKGQISPAAAVFADLRLPPMDIAIREGIAIMNGTSAMTGIAVINIIAAKRQLIFSVLLSTIINEIMEAYDDPLSHGLNAAKLHDGQQEVAYWMRAFSASGHRLRSREHLHAAARTGDTNEFEQVQEVYSLRCIPQIAGPVLDTIAYAETVILNEINSVNDNPVIDHRSGQVLHGGNFHGDYLSLEMDKLKLVIVKLSMLAERQLNFLLNPAINKKLPPFLNRLTPGLNFGMQGMQYTATSNVAENQALSTSLYVHSIPSNNDNQDIVSMGCNAAQACTKVIDNTWEVLAITATAVAEALEILDAVPTVSDTGRWLHTFVRAVMPPILEDSSAGRSLGQLKAALESCALEDIFADIIHHD